ncbi:MAG TPA: hypothetical protein VLX28_01255 [Thermoanaerobaculia bacterium]|nr:hypothetical protein [Thermoanaerobaculia bacterium]
MRRFSTATVLGGLLLLAASWNLSASDTPKTQRPTRRKAVASRKTGKADVKLENLYVDSEIIEFFTVNLGRADQPVPAGETASLGSVQIYQLGGSEAEPPASQADPAEAAEPADDDEAAPAEEMQAAPEAAEAPEAPEAAEEMEPAADDSQEEPAAKPETAPQTDQAPAAQPDPGAAKSPAAPAAKEAPKTPPPATSSQTPPPPPPSIR